MILTVKLFRTANKVVITVHVSCNKMLQYKTDSRSCAHFLCCSTTALPRPGDASAVQRHKMFHAQWNVDATCNYHLDSSAKTHEHLGHSVQVKYMYS